MQIENILVLIDLKKAYKRECPEKENPDQTPFEKDISRIKYSLSYRLLSEKTQVYVPELTTGLVVVRNRLLHTAEVAETAIRIARRLGLRPDLTEAVARLHDVGHPPFGHAGEECLNELMRKFGKTFDHDSQVLIGVQQLESISEKFNGLNLTLQVIREIEARASRHHPEGSRLGIKRFMPLGTTLEGQIVALADNLVYIIHDIEDSLRLGYLCFKDLAENKLLKKYYTQLSKN